MPPKRKAAAAAAAAQAPEPVEAGHEKPESEPITPCQTIYIKNLNEKIRKPGMNLDSGLFC